MKESISVVSMKTKGKGVFDMAELYQNMKFWLDFQGYGNAEQTFQEEKYVERIKGDSKQIEIRWRADKIFNDYVSYTIGITFFIIGLKDVQIEKDGKKIGSNKGEVEIRFNAKLNLDWKNKWKSNSIQSLYNNFIIRDKIESHKTDLYNKTYTLYDEVKKFFEMYGV
jgi:hypothetical protein